MKIKFDWSAIKSNEKSETLPTVKEDTYEAERRKATAEADLAELVAYQNWSRSRPKSIGDGIASAGFDLAIAAVIVTWMILYHP